MSSIQTKLEKRSENADLCQGQQPTLFMICKPAAANANTLYIWIYFQIYTLVPTCVSWRITNTHECGLWYGVIVFLHWLFLSLLNLTAINWILKRMTLLSADFQSDRMLYLATLTRLNCAHRDTQTNRNLFGGGNYIVHSQAWHFHLNNMKHAPFSNVRTI